MTGIRDGLMAVVRPAIVIPGADHVDDEVGRVVDAVLEWLGDIDPDCSPELLRWHLTTNRATIAELRAGRNRMDDDVRKTLLMLAEKHTERPVTGCGRCGHDASDHRLDDAGPPPATDVDDAPTPARCVYPVTRERMGVVPLCDCPDFTPYERSTT